MMGYLKKINLSHFLALFAITALLLSGCIYTGAPSSISRSKHDDSKESEFKQVTVGEIFKTSDYQVWYDVFDEIGKDGVVYNIYVVDNGEVTIYQGDCFNMSLGQAAQYGDEWAIETAKQGEAHYFESFPEVYHGSVIGPTYASVVGHTDKTGNTIVSETIYIGDDPNTTYGTEFDINSGQIYSGQVYDAYYVGFDRERGGRLRYFVTLDRGETYTLDSRDSEYIDYWD